MGLLQVVVGDLANVAEHDDSVLQVIAALGTLILAETLLLGNQHLINALVKRWAKGAFFCGRWHVELHCGLVFVGNVKAVHKLLLLAKSFLSFQPERYCVLVLLAILSCLNAKQLLKTFLALRGSMAIYNVDQNREKFILGRIALFELFTLLVAEAQVHLLKDGAEVNGDWHVFVHFPDHRKDIMINRKSHIAMDISESLDCLLRDFKVVITSLSLAEVAQGSVRHPFHLLLADSGEALLRALDLSDGIRKRLTFLTNVDELPSIVRIVGGCKCLLKRHNRVSRLLTSDMADLSKHEVLDVRPVHTQVDDVSLHIHTTATGTSLHLLGDKGGQVITHVTTENAGTERHVHPVGKSRVRKDDSKTSLLCEHLHLTTVARESNFIRIDGNTTTKTTDKGMVDVHLLSRLLHVCDDVFDFTEVQSLSSTSQHILVVRAGCVFVDHGLIHKT
mmetsp:Transcript_88324/g.254817  ORF Transcript_88324/g.254817 Transcript_88324/m.254817 type:complete len:448 (-) Transcript_88324:2556-3899(-)